MIVSMTEPISQAGEDVKERHTKYGTSRYLTLTIWHVITHTKRSDDCFND